MNAFTFNGPAAELRWGYHQAAALGSWTVKQEGASITLTARIVTADAFRTSQQPLVFCVPRQPKPWTWPVRTLHIADGRLSAQLDPQE
jgi:hypothetical protein